MAEQVRIQVRLSYDAYQVLCRYKAEWLLRSFSDAIIKMGDKIDKQIN